MFWVDNKFLSSCNHKLLWLSLGCKCEVGYIAYMNAFAMGWLAGLSFVSKLIWLLLP